MIETATHPQVVFGRERKAVGKKEGGKFECLVGRCVLLMVGIMEKWGDGIQWKLR